MESGCRYLDATMGELLFDHKVKGEHVYCFRTDVLRQYPFPDITKTNFVPEGQVLLRVPGLIRCVNEPLRVYHRGETDNLTHSKWRNSWRGMLFYYAWLLTHRPRYFWLSLSSKFRNQIARRPRQ